MKWIGKRISFIEDSNKTTIVVYPEETGWVKAIMGAWVAMWMVIGATVIWSYFTFDLTNQEDILIVVFLVFWAYYAFRVMRSWFWLLWGKELIKIDEASLTYKKSIRSFGKATSYLVDNISKIDLFHPKERSFQSVWEKSPWITTGGERIAFDYMGKVIRFGRKLEEKDAKLLFKLITKRVEEKVRHLNKKSTTK